MRRADIPYCADELAWIETNATRPRREAHAEFCTRFNRSDVSLDHFKSLCKRKGWLTGRTGCFEKGSVPANKGRKMPFNEKSAQTQFKAGQVPHNMKHAGHERLSKDGYVMISINETNPHTGYERRYVLKHRHLWEREHGPLPKDHCLKCWGDKTNTDPSNWVAVPRALLPRLNGRFGRGFDAASPELKRTILQTALLEHAARSARKNAKEVGT